MYAAFIATLIRRGFRLIFMGLFTGLVVSSRPRLPSPSEDAWLAATLLGMMSVVDPSFFTDPEWSSPCAMERVGAFFVPWHCLWASFVIAGALKK